MILIGFSQSFRISPESVALSKSLKISVRMKSIVGGLVFDFCSEPCLKLNQLKSSDLIEENIRMCSGCAARNLDLMVVLAGGPFPAENFEATNRIVPTVFINQRGIEIEAQRSQPRMANNESFFRFVRGQQEQAGQRVNGQVLVKEAAVKWRNMSEEERSIFTNPTFFSVTIPFGRTSHQ